jgi:hypothetical protein
MSYVNHNSTGGLARSFSGSEDVEKRRLYEACKKEEREDF